MTKYDSMRVGDKYEQGFNWTAWLSGATISTSTWSVSPASGITLSGAANTTTQTSVFVEPTAAGTYRLTNTITDSAGREGSDEILVVAEDVAALYGYLTTNDAEARLYARWRIEAEIAPADLLAAAYELDRYGGPWIGQRQDSAQALAFPRTVTPEGATAGASVPDAILDAVALLAYSTSEDEGPAVTSESVLDRSITYAAPKASQAISRVAALIAPYQLKVGQRVGASSSGASPVKREYGDYEEPPWYY